MLQLNIDLLFNQPQRHILCILWKPKKDIKGCILTPPGAGVADQEDPGELRQDDQQRGEGLEETPLQ